MLIGYMRVSTVEQNLDPNATVLSAPAVRRFSTTCAPAGQQNGIYREIRDYVVPNTRAGYQLLIPDRKRLAASPDRLERRSGNLEVEPGPYRGEWL
ncbi:hypothetical protein ACCS93_33360 [Rhizobium ruizarguesonis]